MSQTFAYDPYGNLSKSGTFPFQPTYNAATNRYSSIPGVTVSYDNNGNVLWDGQHAYAWDVYGKSIAVDSVNLTYDALGRMVEQNRSGAYTQIVYSPTGAKLALMNGQTLTKGLIGLPGGGQAVYNSSGLLYYGHADHLGSIKMGSTPGRAFSWSLAFAPFGEIYSNSGPIDPDFTGMRSDIGGGIYDFPAREYTYLGRWPAPDPAGLAAVDPSNPQSWNRHAYVLNNPLALIDPTGLHDCHANDDGSLDCGCPAAYGPGSNCPDTFSDGNSGSGIDQFFLLSAPLDFTWIVVPCMGGDGCVHGWTELQVPNFTFPDLLSIPGQNFGGAGNASAQLTKLLTQLQSCKQASGMAKTLQQMLDSGKLRLGNLGTADGSTSLTGTITIDATSGTGITARNLGHEYFHTLQMGTLIATGNAAGGWTAGPLAGPALWAGARFYNQALGLINFNKPGYLPPLDKEAEAFGESISAACGIE